MKMTILPRIIYKLNVISMKIPTQYFTEIEKRNLKFYLETQTPWIRVLASFPPEDGQLGIRDASWNHAAQIRHEVILV